MTKASLKTHDFFSSDDLPIVVLTRSPQPVFPRHSHEFSELVIVTGGTGVHAMEDFSYPVSRGDVFVIQGGEEHEYGQMADLHLVNILFQAERLQVGEEALRDLPGYRALFLLEPEYRRQHRFESHLRLPEVTLRRVQRLVADLEEELAQRTPGYRLMARGLFYQLLGVLCRSYGALETPQARDLVRIAEAIQYLEENVTEAEVLEPLPEIAHMSRRTFQRVFKKAMGMTSVEYLNRLRVRSAGELLRTTDRSISAIAFTVGYRDSNYFSRVFRSLTGFSPRDFRRREIH